MARKKFLRSKWRTYSKLGRGRRKKQKYRRPGGRHSKMREKMKGNPRKVEIGYKKSKKKQKIQIIVSIGDLLDLKKGDKAILARIGKKKKIEIAKKAKQLNIEIQNLNIEKFLKKIEEEQKRKREEKEKKKKEQKKEEKEQEIKEEEKAEEKKILKEDKK